MASVGALVKSGPVGSSSGAALVAQTPRVPHTAFHRLSASGRLKSDDYVMVGDDVYFWPDLTGQILKIVSSGFNDNLQKTLQRKLAKTKKTDYHKEIYAFFNDAKGVLKDKQKLARKDFRKEMPRWIKNLPQRGLAFWMKNFIPAVLLHVLLQLLFAYGFTQLVDAEHEMHFGKAVYHCLCVQCLDGTTQKWMTNDASRLLSSLHMVVSFSLLWGTVQDVADQSWVRFETIKRWMGRGVPRCAWSPDCMCAATPLLSL